MGTIIDGKTGDAGRLLQLQLTFLRDAMRHIQLPGRIA
jgi:hypothetical protein